MAAMMGKTSQLQLWNLPWDGGCRCGRVRFQITQPPLITSACHCKGCQRMTASAYSLSAGFSSEALAVTQGDPVIGALHGEHRHFYCAYCKSWLFTRPHGFDWFVNVRSTMLDDASWYVPFIETFTSERLSWARTPARHSFPRFPDDKDWPTLMEQFKALGTTRA